MTNFSLIVQKAQRCFQNWRTPGSEEPQRSKEELRVIYDDLVEVRKTQNSLYQLGKLMPTPMNGKTWTEEKAGFWNKAIGSYTDLVRSGGIESCEILTFCEGSAAFCRERASREGFWNHMGYHFYHSSEFVLENSEYTLDDTIEAINRIISGTATSRQREEVKEILDSIGTSACEPRAMIGTGLDDHRSYTYSAVDATQNNKSKLYSII